MYNSIKRILDSALDADIVLNIPRDSKMGHFATPHALTLAKTLKKNPNEIANEIKQTLQNLPQFREISVLNGFVNLTLSDEFLAEIARGILENGGFGGESRAGCVDSNTDSADSRANRSDSKQTILLEFVSANPTGPLHIGHARGAIYGDTLARIGRFLGHKIITEYYINDAGNQIDTLARSVFGAACEILGVPKNGAENSADDESDCYKGDYVADLAKDAIAHIGNEFFSDSANCPKLRDFSVAKMLDLIKANLKSANIVFDNFVSEKSLIKNLDSTLHALKSHNALYENEGKIWLKSTQFGDEKDRVVIRENGAPTYLAGDIIYHNDKFSRGFSHYINIWGADHHGYIARIKACVEFLGFDSRKLEVLLSQMVSLLKGGVPYKMSKRAGNFILMQEVIDEIGIDALRFIFITKRADTHLEFDIADLTKEDASNPIFYVNYANARIHTLLGKTSVSPNLDFSALSAESADSWKDLLFYALLLPRILEVAFNERAMQKLPEYLKNLASKLHFCYNSYKIIGSKDESAILGILQIVSLSITTGLSLMGIIAKTKM